MSARRRSGCALISSDSRPSVRSVRPCAAPRDAGPPLKEKLRTRTCGDCERELPIASFATSRRMVCVDCEDLKLDTYRCVVCGGLAISSYGSRRLKYCPKVACQKERYRLLTRASNAAASRTRRRVKKAHRCPACEVTKPRTLEHFTVAKRNPDGSIYSWYSWCRTCSAAYKRAQLEEAHQRRALSDPAFAEKLRKRRAKDAPTEPGPQRAASGPRIALEPLKAAIDRWLETEEDASVGSLALRSGIPERRIWGIRNFEYEHVSMVTADLIATAMDLHLDLIYDE